MCLGFEPRRQVGRCRWIHWATAAPLAQRFFATTDFRFDYLVPSFQDLNRCPMRLELFRGRRWRHNWVQMVSCCVPDIPKYYAVDVSQHSINVWLFGRSTCSCPSADDCFNRTNHRQAGSDLRRICNFPFRSFNPVAKPVWRGRTKAHMRPRSCEVIHLRMMENKDGVQCEK